MTDEQIAAFSHADLIDLYLRIGERLDAVRSATRQEAVMKARALCVEYDIEPISIFGLNPWSGRKPQRELPVKYRDPVSGATWLGVGRTPNWLVGNHDHFKVPNLVG